MRFSYDNAIADVGELRFDEPKIFEGGDIFGHHEGVDFFCEYYDALCAKRDGKPCRGDVNPQDLKRYIPHVVLLDVESLEPFNLRVRLIGTHVAETYGEQTGRLIKDMGNQKAAARIQQMNLLCIQKEQPLLSVTAGIGPNQEHLMSSAYYAPLYVDDEPRMTITAVFVERLNAEQIHRLFDNSQR